MPKITIYQKPTCTTCRKVYTALKDSGVRFNAINYYADPIPKSKIKKLLSKMNISASELLRKKDPVYKKIPHFVRHIFLHLRKGIFAVP